MIYLHYKGRFPQFERFQSFCEEVVDDLFPNETVHDWDIGIQMHSNLCYGENQQDSGLCYYGGTDNIVLVDLARNYIADVGKKTERTIPYSMKELCVTLVHEMVHCKQYISGETSSVQKSNKMIEGFPQYWWSDNFGHYDLPWEQEAHSYENVLLDLW